MRVRCTSGSSRSAASRAWRLIELRGPAEAVDDGADELGQLGRHAAARRRRAAVGGGRLERELAHEVVDVGLGLEQQVGRHRAQLDGVQRLDAAGRGRLGRRVRAAGRGPSAPSRPSSAQTTLPPRSSSSTPHERVSASTSASPRPVMATLLRRTGTGRSAPRSATSRRTPSGSSRRRRRTGGPPWSRAFVTSSVTTSAASSATPAGRPPSGAAREGAAATDLLEAAREHELAGVAAHPHLSGPAAEPALDDRLCTHHRARAVRGRRGRARAAPRPPAPPARRGGA